MPGGPADAGWSFFLHMCILHELVEHSISSTSDIKWQPYDLLDGLFVGALQYKELRRNRWMLINPGKVIALR